MLERILSTVLALLFSWLAFPAVPEARELPSQVERAVEGLLDAVRGGSFRQQDAGPVLDYLLTATPEDVAALELDERLDAEGAAYLFSVDAGLSRVLDYSFDPCLPGHLLLPQLVRAAGWERCGESGGALMNEPGNEPIVVRGREFESNTPGEQGVWYDYLMDRLMVRLRTRASNVLISVALQDEESSVGRKGAVLDPEQGRFFYSDIPGLNRGGVSWAHSYIYKSASVYFFVERDVQPGRVQVLYLKWMRAGWRGFNMVEREDVREGQVRYADALARALESELLPAAAMADLHEAATTLPEQRLRQWADAYSRAFEREYADSEQLDRNSFQEIIADGGYQSVFDRRGLAALLGQEYLRCASGRPTLTAPCRDEELARALGRPFRDGGAPTPTP